MDRMNDETLAKIWRLTTELANQLSDHRKNVSVFQQQASDIKERLEHNRKEEVESNKISRESESGEKNKRVHSYESDNASLNARVEHLEEHNMELRELMRDYEAVIEIAMKKLRSQAFAQQQAKLELQREYEARLEEERHRTALLLSENLLLQQQIIRVGELVRRAFESEIESHADYDSLAQALIVENRELAEALGIAEHLEKRDEVNRRKGVDE
ncbi:uncharacterized protein VTP21DRAFT_4307 [Calcarisporiella thermophila]|uniref:uncharacterized protein n=1 Tax=Calcarisporiella thermophila TaxID=911321 RepID=UPI0037447F15